MRKISIVFDILIWTLSTKVTNLPLTDKLIFFCTRQPGIQERIFIKLSALIGNLLFKGLQSSLCTDVTLDEARERTSVSWMKIPCSGHVDFPQIWGKASDWTVLYLNNL